jgi:hypothetical protein
LGRALGLPVVRLLRGTVRPLDAYDSYGVVDPSGDADVLAASVASGYKAIKIKCGDRRAGIDDRRGAVSRLARTQTRFATVPQHRATAESRLPESTRRRGFATLIFPAAATYAIRLSCASVKGTFRSSAMCVVMSAIGAKLTYGARRRNVEDDPCRTCGFQDCSRAGPPVSHSRRPSSLI